MTQPTMIAALRSIAGINSDREKVSALIALAEQPGVLTDDVVRRVFLATTKGINSSSEYRRVMEAVIR